MSIEVFRRTCWLKIRSAWTLPLLCAALACHLSAGISPVILSISGAGLSATASVDDGAYQILAASQGWTFKGSAGPLRNVMLSDGSDAIGAWNQISFDHGLARTSSIRLYNSAPVVLFS